MMTSTHIAVAVERLAGDDFVLQHDRNFDLPCREARFIALIDTPGCRYR